MSEQRDTDQPFKPLGIRLKRLREKLQESLAEVSGAVEIDSDALLAFEQGKNRPSKDILLLLISYFDVNEDDAIKLWKTAGYSHDELPLFNTRSNEPGNIIQTILVMPVDTRVIYTDQVNVMVNNHGVIMNFMQSITSNGQPVPVARLGMSKEHAKSVLEVLQKTLEQSEPKALPESLPNTDKHRKN
ncbi:helix-turn-helix transcriptional regulator [Candidatus Saccharibacteria bacterium]|nr:helix-turn-helix transcriptional regulator [Candidatus Saccharibacteria bacterium]MBI3338435.1 helix-turn-helix transcriptional regulator [Candidatus Saccharibacteria bacterium]